MYSWIFVVIGTYGGILYHRCVFLFVERHGSVQNSYMEDFTHGKFALCTNLQVIERAWL